MYDDDTSIANLIIAEAGIQINIRAWGGGGGGGGGYIVTAAIMMYLFCITVFCIIETWMHYLMS